MAARSRFNRRFWDKARSGDPLHSATASPGSAGCAAWAAPPQDLVAAESSGYPLSTIHRRKTKKKPATAATVPHRAATVKKRSALARRTPESHHRAPAQADVGVHWAGKLYRDQGKWHTLKMPGGSLRWARDRPEKSPAFARNFAEKRTHPSSAAQLFLNQRGWRRAVLKAPGGWLSHCSVVGDSQACSDCD